MKKDNGMITIKEFMEIIDYKITEGSDYGWQCYGANAHRLDSWNGSHDGHSVSIVFDTKTQEAYEVSAYDYRNNRAYRLINPNYKVAHNDEANSRGVDINQAWDDVDYVDLDVDDDFIQKAQAIVAGEDYDTRVSIPIVFSDEEMLQYMMAAHERDITFNQFVEQALMSAIEDYKANLPHVTNTDNPIDFPVITGKKNKKKGK
jgi:hypothetical protein